MGLLSGNIRETKYHEENVPYGEKKVKLNSIYDIWRFSGPCKSWPQQSKTFRNSLQMLIFNR